MTPNAFQKDPNTTFEHGDQLEFRPDGRTESIGSTEEGLARQAVYGSFVRNEVLGHNEVIRRAVEVRGVNIEAMRKHVLGLEPETNTTIAELPVDSAETAKASEETFDNFQYHVPSKVEDAA